MHKTTWLLSHSEIELTCLPEETQRLIHLCTAEVQGSTVHTNNNRKKKKTPHIDKLISI